MDWLPTLLFGAFFAAIPLGWYLNDRFYRFIRKGQRATPGE